MNLGDRGYGAGGNTRATVGVLVLLLSAAAALAQTGGIKITVTDPEGRPLPGATVTISNETAYVKTTSELTDIRGIVEFPVLRPGGGYAIQVSFPGFSPLRYDELRVRLSATLPLTVQMIEEVHERVTVTTTSDMITLDRTETSTRFTDEFIADLPVPGRFYTNVLTMAPGVQDADGDGNPNVHGSRSRDFQAVVSGVSHVDPLTGHNFGRLNLNSIEELEVITAGAGVEFGRAQGGFARIIQKQGSNRHEGIVEFYWRTSRLDGDGASDPGDMPTQKFDSYQPAFQFTGPLLRDRLWYRVSYERIDDELPVNVLSGIEVFEQVRETQDAQLTWQISPRNKLALQFRGDPSEARNFGISNLVRPESSRHLEREVETWSLNWTVPFSPKVLVESTVAWQDVNMFQGPTRRGLLNDCVPNATEAFLNQAYCNDLSRNVVSGSWFRTHDDRRQRFTVKGRATIHGGKFWGMRHEFKLGFSIENERYFRFLEERGSITYQIVTLGAGDDQGDEPELDAFGLVNSRLAVPASDDVRATGTHWAVYAEDQLKPIENLTLTLGARVDREETNSEGREVFDPQAELAAFREHVELLPNTGLDDWPAFFTGYENIAAFEGQLADILCEELDEGEDVEASCATLVTEQVLSQTTDDLVLKRQGTNIHIQNTNLSPFLAVAWAPWADGKTAFKASVGRYYNNIPLMIPLQELNPVVTNVQYRASLVDPEDCPPPEEGPPDGPIPDPDPPPVACGKSKISGGIQPLLTIMTVDRDIKTPYQDEFTFKVERELWAETAMSLTYVNRRFRDQIQDVNINVAGGDLGRCRRQTTVAVDPIVRSPGRTLGVCSTSLIPCAADDGCPGGEICGYDLYFVDPIGFCEITGDCLDNHFGFPAHACDPGLDPFCGVSYPDMNPGDGDGFIDPVTGFVDGDGDGFADDNCVGETIINGVDCGGDPFCSDVEILRRPDTVADLYLQNPFWGPVHLIGNFNSIDYEAFVFELVRRQYRSWEMNGSYTWSEARGDGEDFFQELGNDPTLRAATFGAQSYDQTHVVKLNATTITPWGVRLGTAVTWQSGLPYSLVVEELSFDTKPPITAAFAGEGARPRRTYTTGVRNDQRNQAYWNVDLKATKELRLGKGMNLQVSAEIFNLLDDGTYQVYNPFFERGVQINGRNEAQRRFGRRWQLGMKVAF